MDSSSPNSIRATKWADETVLRQIFNDLRIPERADSGELQRNITRSKPVPEEKNIHNWIPGTLSQEVKYFDSENNLVAKAHRYLRPDGLLAASGKEDPKRVLYLDIMYIREEPKKPSEIHLELRVETSIDPKPMAE